MKARRINDVLIGRTLGVARSTIQDNLKRAAVAGLAWPLAGPLTDAVLEQRLFALAGVKRGFRRRAEPDWGSLACELKRPGVNLMVLWEEYRAIHPSGYGYSRFCDLLTLAHAQTSFSAGRPHGLARALRGMDPQRNEPGQVVRVQPAGHDPGRHLRIPQNLISTLMCMMSAFGR
jgi:hypothetical protein